MWRVSFRKRVGWYEKKWREKAGKKGAQERKQGRSESEGQEKDKGEEGGRGKGIRARPSVVPPTWWGRLPGLALDLPLPAPLVLHLSEGTTERVPVRDGERKRAKNGGVKTKVARPPAACALRGSGRLAAEPAWPQSEQRGTSAAGDGAPEYPGNRAARPGPPKQICALGGSGRRT